jgi:glycosyltransferase involved in cell wall biosynthesis
MSYARRSAPIVTVVVPTYNRPRQLRGCLDALSRQTISGDDLEVVIVDDGGTTPLDALLTENSTLSRVRLVRQENAGPAAARNHGVRVASGSLVAFTDDDCRPHPDWLRTLVAGASEFPARLVGGTTKNGLKNAIFSETSQLIVEMVYEHFNADQWNAYFLTSNNFLCTRAAFLELGGFDPAFDRAGAEDRDFCDRWRASRQKLVWLPEAIVEHHHVQNLCGFIGLHYRYGRGAFRYHQRRQMRESGTLKEDMGFQRSWPRLAWRRIERYPRLSSRLAILAALGLWQAANIVGLFTAMLGSSTNRESRSPDSQPRAATRGTCEANLESDGWGR